MRDYIQNMLHADVISEPVNVSVLPLYLRGLYTFERWTVFDVPFVMAFPSESSTIKTMSKHCSLLEKSLGLPVAFSLEDATSYRVERMVEAGLSFVVVGSQVYLPFLGVALRESKAFSRMPRKVEPKTLSPQAQRLTLMMLYGDLEDVSVTRAADLLGTAKMTASRSFDEVAAICPSLVEYDGRRRVLRPSVDKWALWQRLKPFMFNPVVREHYLDYIPKRNLPLGGISALCAISMLQDNPWPTFVVARAEEQSLGLSNDTQTGAFDELDDPACIVQVVRYEPVCAPACSVDPLSAILSFSDEDDDDPRLASEVESVLSKVFGGPNAGDR